MKRVKLNSSHSSPVIHTPLSQCLKFVLASLTFPNLAPFTFSLDLSLLLCSEEEIPGQDI